MTERHGKWQNISIDMNMNMNMNMYMHAWSIDMNMNMYMHAWSYTYVENETLIIEQSRDHDNMQAKRGQARKMT